MLSCEPRLRVHTLKCGRGRAGPGLSEFALTLATTSQASARA